jgi:hypothetical protein
MSTSLRILVFKSKPYRREKRSTAVSRIIRKQAEVTRVSTRSVRLDEEAESALAEIINRTGVSISEAIKIGLIEYRNSARKTRKKSPSDFFASYDFGEGGYTIAPARKSKAALKAKLKNKPGKK